MLYSQIPIIYCYIVINIPDSEVGDFFFFCLDLDFWTTSSAEDERSEDSFALLHFF